MAHLFWSLLSVCMTRFTILVSSSKYILVRVNQLWEDAEQYCNTNYGTSLASIHSWQDNLEASDLCEAGSYDWSYLIACSIGLNDKAKERGTNQTGWLWSDGSDYNWKLWRGTTASNDADNDDCVVMFTADHPLESWRRRWTNVKCDVANYYALCNRPPTSDPTLAPSISKHPSKSPTMLPTKAPTNNPSKNPTNHPINNPTNNPINPTNNPTNGPTYNPTNNPTNDPTHSPSYNPTIYQDEGSVIEIITTIFTDLKTTLAQNVSNEAHTGVIWMVVVSAVIVVIIIILIAIICRILRVNEQTKVNANNMRDHDIDQQNEPTHAMKVADESAGTLAGKSAKSENDTDPNHIELQTSIDLDVVGDLEIDQNEYITAGEHDAHKTHNSETDAYDKGEESRHDEQMIQTEHDGCEDEDDDILVGVNTLRESFTL